MTRFHNWVETEVSEKSTDLPSAVCNSLWSDTDWNKADGKCVAPVRPEKGSIKDLQGWPDEHLPNGSLWLLKWLTRWWAEKNEDEAKSASLRIQTGERYDCFLFDYFLWELNAWNTDTGADLEEEQVKQQIFLTGQCNRLSWNRKTFCGH